MSNYQYSVDVVKELNLNRDRFTISLLRLMAEQSYVRDPEKYRHLVLLSNNDLPLDISQYQPTDTAITMLVYLYLSKTSNLWSPIGMTYRGESVPVINVTDGYNHILSDTSFVYEELDQRYQVPLCNGEQVFLWEYDQDVYGPLYNMKLGDTSTTRISTRIPTVTEFLNTIYAYWYQEEGTPIMDASTLIDLEMEPSIELVYSTLNQMRLDPYIIKQIMGWILYKRTLTVYNSLLRSYTPFRCPSGFNARYSDLGIQFQ